MKTTAFINKQAGQRGEGCCSTQTPTKFAHVKFRAVQMSRLLALLIHAIGCTPHKCLAKAKFLQFKLGKSYLSTNGKCFSFTLACLKILFAI